jgi:transposase
LQKISTDRRWHNGSGTPEGGRSAPEQTDDVSLRFNRSTGDEPCPDYIYRHRNLIERCWSRLKEWRAIATRYDKTAISYAAGVAIAATLDWFKSSG